MEPYSALILLFAGLGAGIMTGLIGASAVTFMAGILIVFLHFPAYEAIGISLLTDVFASLVSAHIYTKSKNIDIRRGIIIGLLATVFAFLGSIAARSIPDIALGDALGIVILITGIGFLKNPLKREETKWMKYFRDKKILGSILIGIFVGLFCGFLGVGGGIIILISLVFILRYPIKTAVGTSVLIMAFISLSGGIGHFIGLNFPITEIFIATIGATIGAFIASKYANKTPDEKMFRITGIVLILISLAVIFKKFFHLVGLYYF